MKGSITIRMYLRDFKIIRHVFPAQRGEKMPSYFERLSEFLNEWIGVRK